MEANTLLLLHCAGTVLQGLVLITGMVFSRQATLDGELKANLSWTT
jgi:hypothetical protein